MIAAEKKRTETMAALDEAFSDDLVRFLALHRDELNLSNEDFEWGALLAWTFGQVPAIVNRANYDSYVRQMNNLLAKAGAPLSKKEFARFVRTRDGALAVAMASRMMEWMQAGNANLKR